MLYGTDPAFPTNLCDKIIPQTITALNLIRQSHLNPSLSAYAQVWDAFDFNRTPLALPSTKVMVHEKPASRETWDPHANTALYTGPAMRRYHYYRVWVWETHAEFISDTLTWFPLANQLLESPIAPIADKNRAVLQQLATIFTNHTIPPIRPTLGFGQLTRVWYRNHNNSLYAWRHYQW